MFQEIFCLCPQEKHFCIDRIFQLPSALPTLIKSQMLRPPTLRNVFNIVDLAKKRRQQNL